MPLRKLARISQPPLVPDAISDYLESIEAARRLGNDTEHTHRPALKALLDALDENIVATNEPRRVACGARDFVITRCRDLIVKHPKAKIVGLTLGHDARAHDLPEYQKLLLKAVVWASGR